MKYLATIGMMFVLMASAPGDEQNGLLLSVQKTVLDKAKTPHAFDDWTKVDKALALKVTASNTSLSDMPAGTITCTLVIKRWGHDPAEYVSYTKTEPFPPLKTSEEINMVLCKTKVGGYESSADRREFQDSIEGWQIIVKHGEVETLNMTSNGDYDKLLAESKPGR